MVDALHAALRDAETHLLAISSFTRAKPMRAVVDESSFDDLKPAMLRCFAVLDWYARLTAAVGGALAELAAGESQAGQAALLGAIDACVLIESQFSAWSAAMNRFSWFKRTVKELGSKIAHDPDIALIRTNLDAFQAFIANVQFPIGIHMSGPLRAEVKKVPNHEATLLSTLEFGVKRVTLPRPTDAELRPLPLLIVYADGDATPGSFNVFTAARPQLKGAMQLFKKFPEVEAAPPDSDDSEGAVKLHLAIMLQRCPHYTQQIGAKWGTPGAVGGTKCVVQ